MAKKDWYEAGEQIKQLVQEAVDSRDFSQLSSTITNIVNSTVDGLQSALKENLSQGSQAGTRRSQGTSQSSGPAGRAAGRAGTPGGGGPAGQTAGRAGTPGGGGPAGQAAGNAGMSAQSAAGRGRTGIYEYSNRAAAEQIRRRLQEKERRQEPEKSRERALPVRAKAPGEITGRVMKWFGYGMSSILGLSLAIVVIVSLTTGVPLLLPIAILALLTGVNFYIASRGTDQLNMAKRFRRYTEIIGDRKSCMLEELAAAVGRTAKYVRRDLRQMIERGFFREAYLNRKGDMLIMDHATYQKYLEVEAESRDEQRSTEEEERRRAEEMKTRAEAGQEEQDVRELTPECRELIAEGKKYIRHVHECNEKIEDTQMSAKLDRLELVITRIFREAERNPSVAGDLRKMMSYYLPTTRKLLDAYCEMNAQPIRGQNIENMQKEIQGALDTINTAFENLLDSLFEDKAWDISSDITVLNTMLAQEGLTGKDFEQK